MLRNNKGIALAIIALLLTVIMGLGAIVVDLAQAYTLKTKIKNAIDSAVLAGVSQLASQSDVTSAKNKALEFLNSNLTTTIPSFTALTLNSTGLSVQTGVYDSSTMAFTASDTDSNVNAVMVSYTYNTSTILAKIFNVSTLDIGDKATAAKQYAGYIAPGGAFPIVIYTSALTTALSNSNMVDLYTGGSSDNSYWTDFTSSNPSTTDIRNVLDYFQSGTGTKPP